MSKRAHETFQDEMDRRTNQVACDINALIPHQPGYFCAYPEGRHLARRGIAVFHEALSTPPLNA